MLKGREFGVLQESQLGLDAQRHEGASRREQSSQECLSGVGYKYIFFLGVFHYKDRATE